MSYDDKRDAVKHYLEDIHLLIPYCTDIQAKIVRALMESATQEGAATRLGISRSTIRSTLARVKAKAARSGHAPEHGMTQTVPDGYKVKGVSTLYKKDGQMSIQWVKSDIDLERQREIMEEAYSAMAAELPRLEPLKPLEKIKNDLLNLIIFTDYHMGQLSWGKECGEDWDLKIAEQTLLQSFENLIQRAPKAEELVLCLQGDFLHTDGLLPLTPAHKNVLDADGRFSKMVSVAIRCIRRIIDMGIMQGHKVTLIIAEGNHDEAGSMWLRKMFAALYEENPMMSVNDSELPFYVHQHGETMLCFHHGHKVNNEALPLLFAAQFPKIWGNCLKRYAHCGHRHHTDEKEYSGMTVTQHPTLAARDAHSARGGYVSERAANLITYHKRYGQVSRTVVCPEMFE